MKVLLLIPHVANGGAEKLLSQLSHGLRAEIVVVIFERRIDYPVQGRILSMDLSIGKGLWHRVWGLGRRLWRFRRILRDERPDVVVSFMGEANILNALLGRRPILTVHNHLSSLAPFVRSHAETVVSEWLVGALYKRGIVVAVSNAVRQEMVERFRVPADRAVVISNAIDSTTVEQKAMLSAPVPWDPRRPVIITAGRLTPQKGQVHLIRALAEIRKVIPVQLAILGAGELEQSLRQAAQDAGAASDVHFLGWQENPWSYMSQGSLFVLPSLTEGFGLVLLEAMACRLPVIATDCPGAARDILAPELSTDVEVLKPFWGIYGALVPAASESALAEAILALLQNPDQSRNYVVRGVERVREFSYERFVENYQSLIDSAFGEMR